MMAPRLANYYSYEFSFSAAEPLEKEPPHVHIRGSEGIMKVWLETLEIADCKGIPKHIQTKLLKVVKDNQKKFLAIWNEYKNR